MFAEIAFYSSWILPIKTDKGTQTNPPSSLDIGMQTNPPSSLDKGMQTDTPNEVKSEKEILDEGIQTELSTAMTDNEKALTYTDVSDFMDMVDVYADNFLIDDTWNPVDLSKDDIFIDLK